MPLLAIVVLAAITYAFRLAGPLFRDRITLPPAATVLFADAAAVLLIALAATSALMNGHDFAGWARPACVAACWRLGAPRSRSSSWPLPASPPCCAWPASGTGRVAPTRWRCGPQR